jgi:hypothetical protein
MTEAEATEVCRAAQAEHPDRATHCWLPKKLSDGTWAVVKLPGSPPAGEGEIRATVEDKSRIGEDPRSAMLRNLGPNHP